MKADKLHGDWKWFSKDGVIMRSGSFKNGQQTGVWITYDQKGKPYKKTNFGSYLSFNWRIIY
jgi:antitoxin component YwqK of YwqJK toxin-antitoxin module